MPAFYFTNCRFNWLICECNFPTSSCQCLMLDFRLSIWP